MPLLDPTFAGIMGLGLPELLVIALILGILSLPVMLFIWLVYRLANQNSNSSAPTAPPPV